MKVRFYFNDYKFYSDAEWNLRLPKKEEIIFSDTFITFCEGKSNVYFVENIPPHVHQYELVQVTDDSRTLIEYTAIKEIEGFVIETGPFWRNIDGNIHACFLLKESQIPEIPEVAKNPIRR